MGTLAPITREALDKIKEYAQNGVLEIFSGDGLWSEALNQYGIHTTATDIKENGKEVKGIGAIEAVMATTTLHSFTLLLAVWPPDKGKVLGEAMSLYKGANVIVIGNFARYSKGLPSGWIVHESISLPSGSKGTNELIVFKRIKND